MKTHLLPSVLALLCATSAMAADYYVVVPVKGRTAAAPAESIAVSLQAATLPAAVVGQAYSYNLRDHLLVTGDKALDLNQATLTTADTLPAGLSLAANGVLSGTPTVVGSKTFSVSATYKTKSAEQSYMIATSAASAVWDSTAKGTNVVVSGTTASVPGSTMARATIGKSSGKWYWEVKVTSDSFATTVGVANGSANLNNFIGARGTNNSFGLMSSPSNPNGFVCYNGCSSDVSAQFYQNDVMGFALDMDVRRIQIYRNGTLIMTTGVIPADTWYPAVGGQYPGTYVANFGAGGFWQTPPPGFMALE